MLHAQPQMDEKTLEGNVVTERVFRSLRSTTPFVLSEEVALPDFRLVPRDVAWEKTISHGY